MFVSKKCIEQKKSEHKRKEELNDAEHKMKMEQQQAEHERKMVQKQDEHDMEMEKMDKMIRIKELNLETLKISYHIRLTSNGDIASQVQEGAIDDDIEDANEDNIGRLNFLSKRNHRYMVA